MNIADSLIAHFNNSKRNPPTTGRKDKTSSLKTDIIMDNTVKAKKNDDSDSSDSKGNPRRGDKRGGRSYNKKNNNKNKKIQIAKSNKYYRERKKLKP